MNRNKMRLGALAAAGALTAMSIAPAMGADVIAQASANAVTIGVAGNESEVTGRVTATHDGETETVQGEANPPVAVLDGQQLLNVGTLAQDAAAQNQDGDGVSAACSGVAGEDATLVEVGSSDCIIPGDDQIGLDVANLDLSDTIVINPDSALGDLSGPVQEVVGPILTALTPELQAALAPLDSGLNGSFGAIQSRCLATPGNAAGTATLARAGLTLTLGGEDVVIVPLEQNPAPNTEVLVNLEDVLNPIIDDVEEALRLSLEGALADLDQVTGPIQEQIITGIVGQVSEQLGPLQENIISIILNKQTNTGDSVEVTALDLQVLPAAADYIDGSLLSAQIANVTCGPNSTVAPAVEQPETETPDEEELPEIPTVVDSGTSGGAGSPAVVAGLLMLMGAAALLGYRRVLPAGK